MAAGRRHHVIPYIVEFTAQFIHTFWCSMATFPLANLPFSLPNSDQSINATMGAEAPPNGNADYFRNVFMPAIQAGLSVWMQITWSSRMGAAHFNPAVSLGLFIAGKLKPIKLVVFILLQVVASITAAYTVKLMTGGNPGYVAVPPDASGWSVACNEMLTTAFLVFFIMCVAVDEKFDQATSSLAIGFTVFQGLLSANAMGVACISPSYAIGAVVVNGGAAWNRHWLLWVSDLTGATLAAAYYMSFLANDDICWLEKARWRWCDDDDDDNTVGRNGPCANQDAASSRKSSLVVGDAAL